MSTTKHTPAPWYQGRPYYTRANEMRVEVGPDDGTGQYIRRAATANSEANAARIVACVNACEQLEDPGKQIPEMIGVLKQFWQASESGDLDRHDWNALEQVLLELGVLE